MLVVYVSLIALVTASLESPLFSVCSVLREQTKRKIRAKRKRAVDKLKGMTGIGADLQFKMLKDVQDVTTKFTDEASNLLEAKKAEIST